MKTGRRKITAAVDEAIRGRTRIITSTADEIAALLLSVAQAVALDLARQPADGALWMLATLQSEIRRSLDTFAVDAGAVVSRGVGGAYGAGYALVDNILAAAGVNVGPSVFAINNAALSAMQTFSTDRIKGLALSIVDKINTQLGLTVMGAQTPFQAVQAVASLLKDDANDRALVIVRTELGRAFSVANQFRMDEAEGVLPALKKQWRRSGKIHSRLTHDLIDGQVRGVKEPFDLSTPRGRVKLMHPHDPKGPLAEIINCGCVALPYMDGWPMSSPRRRAFTDEEIRLNPIKADLEAAISKKKGAT